MRIKGKWIVLLIILFLLGGISLWYITRDSEEAKVKRKLHELADFGIKAEGEKEIFGALKVNGTDKVFAPQFELSLKYDMFSGTYTPREMTANLARFRMLFKQVKVRVADTVITINGDKADAVFTGLLDGVTADGKAVNEVRELNCTLAKIDGKWLINKLVVRDILEK